MNQFADDVLAFLVAPKVVPSGLQTAHEEIGVNQLLRVCRELAHWWSRDIGNESRRQVLQIRADEIWCRDLKLIYERNLDFQQMAKLDNLVCVYSVDLTDQQIAEIHLGACKCAQPRLSYYSKRPSDVG
ncbi:hypothetical protein N9Y42_09340 [Mariniblastus sp.]|nr:hypothetical protein [Mariniblastus sp.]